MFFILVYIQVARSQFTRLLTNRCGAFCISEKGTAELLILSLQLLLPNYIHFSCMLLPDCILFNCCSPIASTSTAP